MKQFKTLQQGDVLMQRVSIPEDAKKLKPKDRGWVLAEGEVTGHAHVIDQIDNCEMYESEGTLYLHVNEDCTVIHEEHNPIDIPSGDYVISQVVEVDPFEEEIRRVRD